MLSRFVSALVEAAKRWWAHDPSRTGAALAYYSVFSLGPILLIVVSVAGLWISATLVPLFAVVVNERRGIGALRRCYVLTRGAALRLIGVLILYGIVVVVVMAAATSVIGVVARLILGGEAAATVALIVALVSTLVTAPSSAWICPARLISFFPT